MPLTKTEKYLHGIEQQLATIAASCTEDSDQDTDTTDPAGDGQDNGGEE